jgi:catechol 2,3-dioxygenase-like lactoylglutathione lyase family enzyme
VTSGLELFMVGVVVADMPRALEFYRRLGLAVPDESDELAHVEVKMSGLTFFLTTEEGNARWDPARRPITGDGYRIVLEFYLGTADVLDAKYAELTGYGYTGHCAPYDVTTDTRFALVDDPDGNTILLSSQTAPAAEARP